MRQDNRDYIYLVWKDPIERSNHIVGKLSRNGDYVFEYIQEYCEKLDRFRPLVAFSDINKIYTNKKMFATFAARLPDKRRPEIRLILEQYNLKEYDEFELLKRSGGAQPIDTFYFIDPILNVDEPFIERDFFISGTRHHDYCDPVSCLVYINLRVNDMLELELEPNNNYDSNAVKINFNDCFIGYIPKYFSKEVAQCIRNRRKIKCRVIFLNPNKKHCQECVKVKLTIE